MNSYKWTLSLVVLLTSNLAMADVTFENNAAEQKEIKLGTPEGWSFDLGGQYTWMTFTTPPTYKGSTGGVVGKFTYQKPWSFYGQVRSVYNLGKLHSNVNSARIYELCTEFVGGYSFGVNKHWMITPYAGIGMDFIHDNHSSYSDISSIQLRYNLYYAIGGVETRYSWQNYYLGLQLECFPTFNQYLRIKGLTGAAWTLQRRVGADVHIPVGIKIIRSIWFELAPYYRFLPIGSSSVLSLPHRNLNQWGAFATFRFFI